MFNRRGSSEEELEHSLTEKLAPFLDLSETGRTLEDLNQVATKFDQLGMTTAAEEATQLIEKIASPEEAGLDTTGKALHHLKKALVEIKAVPHDPNNQIISNRLRQIAEMVEKSYLYLDGLGSWEEESRSKQYEEEEGPATLRNPPASDAYDAEHGPPTLRNPGFSDTFDSEAGPDTMRSAEQYWQDELTKTAKSKKKTKTEKPKKKSKPAKTTKTKTTKPKKTKKPKAKTTGIDDLFDNLTPEEELRNLEEIGWVFPKPADTFLAEDCNGCGEEYQMMMADDLNWAKEQAPVNKLRRQVRKYKHHPWETGEIEGLDPEFDEIGFVPEIKHEADDFNWMSDCDQNMCGEYPELGMISREDRELADDVNWVEEDPILTHKICRICGFNHLEDWEKAEQEHAVLHGVKLHPSSPIDYEKPSLDDLDDSVEEPLDWIDELDTDDHNWLNARNLDHGTT